MNALPISRRQYWTYMGAIGLLVSPMVLACQHLPYRNTTKRPERTIVVTGATGALGHATCQELAKRNCRIIMACRDMDKCKAIRREIVLLSKNNSIACRRLDLEDIESINNFADDIMEKEPHIDVLINVAGVKPGAPKEREVTKYGIERHYFVNFLAPYLLTLRLMPKLEESAKTTLDSRVVNVVGSPKRNWHIDLNDINFEARAYKPKTAYRQSKLAFAYFTILLEKFNREKCNSVYVFGFSPGAKKINPLHDNTTGLYNELRHAWLYMTGYPAKSVCQRIIYCALDKSLVKEKLSGRNYNFLLDSWGRNHGWNVAAVNEDKAKLVWNVAAEMLVNAKP